MSFSPSRLFVCGVVCSLLGACLPLGGSARGDALNFDDLGPSTGGTMMPSAYGGLRWGNGFTDWHYISTISDPTNTFLALSGTGTFVGAPLGGADFYFDGADFWRRRGLDANGDFYFFLYRDGVTVYNGVEENERQRFSGAHQAFAPSYTGPVDGFALFFDNDDWDHLAMDNLRIREVPAPGPMSLCVAGIGAMLIRRRR